MKKLFLLAVAGVLAMGLSLPAMAALDNTAHDYPNTTGGSCALCHLPHGASAAGRLWVTNPVGGGAVNLVGAVSPLCGYCHQNAGGATGPLTTGIVDPSSTTWVYGDVSHGVLMSNSSLPRGMQASGLPYHTGAGDTAIECTTCHDVHNDPATARPFLRENITILCAGCHGNRMAIGGAWQNGTTALGLADAGNWGANFVGVNNPGSHPVGDDITGNVYGGNSPITIWPSMRVAMSVSVNRWALGGHLSINVTGGVVCVTCHTVHGVLTDAAAKNTLIDDVPFANFLAIEQAPAGFLDNNRTVANGQGAVNYLCEGCHVGTTPDAVYGAAANDVTPDNATDLPEARNPGGTAFGHVVDDMTVDGGLNWVTAFPANWPIGNAFGAGKPAPGVLCESCHAPHPFVDNGRADLLQASASSQDYILRQQYSLVCGECHTAAVSGHHPTGIVFNSAGVTYLNVTGGAGDVLGCGTCHGGGTGAHNWPSRAYVGLDPQWKPVNNGRAFTESVERYRVDASLTCIECHLTADNNATNESPTLHDGFNTNFSTADETAAAYPTRGGAADVNYAASHVIGLLPIRKTRADAATYWGATQLNAVRTDGTTAYNPETTTWATAGFAGAHTGGISRFGGDGTTDAAGTVLVCESCHELQPAKNSNYHLLLADYFEDGVPDAANNRSRFCEGCHKPAGTHPQSGEAVGRAGGSILSTVPNAASNAGVRTWIIAPTDANIIMGANIISCDTCHQPHDAAALSGTFIIDCAYTLLGNNGVSGGAALNAAPVYGNYVAGFIPNVYANKGEKHNKFCSQCHPY